MDTKFNLFVYGTLLFDEVVRAVTDRVFPSVPARLDGYERRSIVRAGCAEPHPALLAVPGASVCGRILLDVDTQSLARIDCYENDPPDYERVSVKVELNEGDFCPAQTYVALPRIVPLLQGAWASDEFKRTHLADYVRRLIPDMRRTWAERA